MCEASQVDMLALRMYVRQREPHRKPTQEQRLEEAYARLHESGAKITTAALAKAAHVRTAAACAYLKQERSYHKQEGVYA